MKFFSAVRGLRLLSCLFLMVAAINTHAAANDDFPVPVLASDASSSDIASLGSNWKLIRTDHFHNIKLYLRKDSSFRVYVIRLTTVFDAPLRSIAAATLDVSDMPEWIWHLRSAELIKTLGPHDIIIHLVISSPYGIEDRDAVIHTHVEQDPKTKVLRLTTTTVDGYVPIEPPLVRMARLQMNWTFTPRPDGKVDAELIGVIDPGGRIPAWTANIIQKSSLYYSIRNLMHVVREDRFAQPNVPFKVEDQ